jgi:alcohol dehydrogenase
VSSGGVDYAIEATGHGEAMQAAVLSTRKRGTAVLIGIPREDVVLTVPAKTIPRMERRIIGSIYGSAYPEHDFLTTLNVYRSGRLPLEKLITHRLPLDEVNQGLELMLSGAATRVVLDTTTQGAS